MFSPRPWLAALLLACSFDPSGLGAVPSSHSDSSGAGDGTTTAGTTAGTSTPATTEPSPGTTTDSTVGVTGSGSGDATTTSTTAPSTVTETGDLTTSTSTSTSSSTSTSTSTSTTTGPDTTTTGPPACNGMFIKEIELVADASVGPPMIKDMSMMGEGMVAFSTVEQQGTVTFTFELECDGNYAVWGRVLDGEPGVHDFDPDSYAARVDGGPEITWYYGCQTGQLPIGYHWLLVRSGFPNQQCDRPTPWTLPLAAGTHTITLRNREPMDDYGNIAAVARLLLTNSPQYTPMPPD